MPNEPQTSKETSSEDRPLNKSSLFTGGALGTLLAFGSFWIQNFGAIESWYQENGNVAAAGALVFLGIVVMVAGWITVDSEPRRVWGALLTGLGVPGAIFAANLGFAEQPSSSVTPGQVKTEDRIVAAGPIQGGLSEMLRPILTPITLVQQHATAQLRDDVQEVHQQINRERATYQEQLAESKRNQDALDAKIRQYQGAIEDLSRVHPALERILQNAGSDERISQLAEWKKEFTQQTLDSVSSKLTNQIQEARQQADLLQEQLVKLRQTNAMLNQKIDRFQSTIEDLNRVDPELQKILQDAPPENRVDQLRQWKTQYKKQILQSTKQELIDAIQQDRPGTGIQSQSAIKSLLEAIEKQDIQLKTNDQTDVR